jgi:type III pantothenate kinase
MFIAIDIGNTHTVVGVYNKDSLLTDLRLDSTVQQTEDGIREQVQSLLMVNGIDKEKIEGIGIASVVPHLAEIYFGMAQKYFHQKPIIVSAALNLGIKIHYDDPKSVGADRICNSIAGYAKYGGPLIIIDCGTATTYDVVAANGDYLGGVIAPGIETSAVDLHRRTAKLPKVELHIPEKIIGTNTTNGMQTGILWGAIDAMTGMVNRIQEELHQQKSKKAIVIATGGFSKFVAAQSNIIQHVEPSLVLDGIRLIYERARNNEVK